MKKTIFALAGAAFLLAACSPAAPPEEPVRAVKVLTVGNAAFSSSHEFAGEVRAQVESRLGFRVAGKIIKRQAELGQRVQAGQVLAQLDPQDYKLAADAAKAQLRAAETNRDLAAADFKRYKELKDQNFISSAELERRETTLKPRRPSMSRPSHSWRCRQPGQLCLAGRGCCGRGHRAGSRPWPGCCGRNACGAYCHRWFARCGFFRS